MLPIFAPSPFYGFSEFASVALALTLPIALGIFVGYRWVTGVPEARSVVRGAVDETVSPIIADFRVRSGIYRIAATATFVLLIGVTAAGFFLLSDPARQRAQYHQAVPAQLPALLAPLIEALLEVVAFEAEDPVLRAAARYYVAAGLMHSANATRTEPEDRNARPPSALRAAMRRARDAQRADARRRALNAATGSLAGRAGTTGTDGARRAALDAATGLSVGVEEVEFPGWGGPDVPTFAEAEADLIRSIRHGTVGATLPPGVTGTRLDGVQESLSGYRGRVVLLDFWATWCEPCVDVMPDLRELVAEMPADRFALIAISVDDEVETVTRFMEDDPMPWTNWHVGRGSDIGRLLRVQGYPTYVLVDEHGRILSRPRFRFAAAVKEAVARLSGIERHARSPSNGLQASSAPSLPAR